MLILLAAGPLGGRALLGQDVSINFDDEGPTATDELADFFDFLRIDNCVGFDPCWNIAPNLQNAADGSNALHTTSDGDQPPNHFSRVAVLNEDVFSSETVQFSADITWDDQGGDANDHAGLYVRFSGQSNVPEENDFYFVRIDAGDPGGTSESIIYLHRMKRGVHEELQSVADAPLRISEGNTVNLTVRARGDEISVWVNDKPVPGMDPFIDPDPLEGEGRVGVGENTNPAYFDNFKVYSSIPCSATRTLSSSRYQPGETVTVTLTARDLEGATTLTETLPPGWSVADAGGGTVNGNTIVFNLDADGEVAYAVAAPGDSCEVVEITGTLAGAGSCAGDVQGDSRLRCVVPPGGGLFYDFDDTGPTAEGEIEDFFMLLGFDPNVGSNWTIQSNPLSPDPSQALRTNSDGNQLMNFFSRVAIISDFEADNVEISADITWDDNDSAGLYVRFIGESHDPLLNDYYHLRGEANGNAGNIHLHRVKDGIPVELASGGPAISQGDTMKFTLRVVDDEIYALVDDVLIPGMDPFVDSDPILDVGRVGVGQETNPGYYDNLRVLTQEEFEPFPCAISRALSKRLYQSGDRLTATLTAAGVAGPTTITETFPDGWTVADNGGGTVAGNTIAFRLDSDGEASYEIVVPDGFCEDAEITGTYAGEENCTGDVKGDSRLICLEPAIYLGDIVAGGDGGGSGEFAAVNLDTGAFMTRQEVDGFNGDTSDTDGVNPSPVDESDFIDSVFFMPEQLMLINSAEVEFEFLVGDPNPASWNHILANKTHDIDKGVERIFAGGQEFLTGVGVHASAGITFDLQALREEFCDEAVETFTTFAGMDNCGGAGVALHIIYSNEDGIVEDPAALDGLTWFFQSPGGGGELYEAEIPPEATFLTLAVGGDKGCGHGVFADARILPGPDGCPTGVNLKPGDVNGDGGFNISDPVAQLNFLFASGPLPVCFTVPGVVPVTLTEAGMAILDFNGDGGNNISDPVGALNFLFGGGAAPVMGEDCVQIEGSCDSACQ